MKELWEIAKHYLDKGKSRWMYVLRQSGGRSFITTCRRKDAYRAQRIEKVASQIFERGSAWAFDAEIMKELNVGKCKVSIFEVRIKGSVIRIAAYLYASSIPIYLFDFDTHAGSGNNVPKHYLKRAVEMALTAATCAADYDFTEYGKRLR